MCYFSPVRGLLLGMNLSCNRLRLSVIAGVTYNFLLVDLLHTVTYVHINLSSNMLRKCLRCF